MSDAMRITAQPFEVVARPRAVARVIELVAEYEVRQIVVGLPTPLQGGEGAATVAARQFGTEVALATSVEVSYIDERFTTAIAERAMLAAGTRRQARRESLDKVAAAIILQAFLDQPA